MVHIMDWSALKFMPTIVPFYEVAVNAPPRDRAIHVVRANVSNWPNSLRQLAQSFN
ncbi:hypothetical protein BCO37747_03869 [Burkholderia contaminans]|jgi:hypothetical protein|nr:hypothetical protein SK875_B01955 [Burkholderia contaminans]VWB49905.1 hypothetical protein BCO23253_02296 [Burkholderia contaminans]VWD20109.1 hypothetical protein BCO37747_03869 [Burkholderia contaminans]